MYSLKYPTSCERPHQISDIISQVHARDIQIYQLLRLNNDIKQAVHEFFVVILLSWKNIVTYIEDL